MQNSEGAPCRVFSYGILYEQEGEVNKAIVTVIDDKIQLFDINVDGGRPVSDELRDDLFKITTMIVEAPRAKVLRLDNIRGNHGCIVGLAVCAGSGYFFSKAHNTVLNFYWALFSKDSLEIACDMPIPPEEGDLLTQIAEQQCLITLHRGAIPGKTQRVFH